MNTLDARLRRFAAGENNVVSRTELRALYITDQMIATQIKRGRWQQLHAGVYLLGAAPPTWQQRCSAALKAAGNHAKLAGETGLAYLEVDGAAQRKVHLQVPVPICPRVPGVKILRTAVPDTGRRGPGLRTTTVERLLVDFAATGKGSRVEEAVECALTKGLTSERRLWEAVATLPERLPGATRLTRVLEERPLGKAARSVLEIELLKVIQRSGLPNPVRNFDVVVGGKRYEIDLAYPENAGAIEADSKRFHSTVSQRAKDKARQAELESIGFRFKRFTWRDVFGRPEWVADEVRELLACALLQAEPEKVRSVDPLSA